MRSELSAILVACVVGAAASVSSGQVYVASGLPIAINDTPTITSTLNVAGGPGSLTSLSLVLRVNHTYVGDLDVVLIRGSKYLHLSSDNGGTAENFANLRFSDNAGLPISVIPSNVNNVEGVYRPEGGSISVSSGATISLAGLTPVSNFAALIAGESANGAWRLWIDDDGTNDVGALTYWSLEFNGLLDPTGPTETPPPPAFAGTFTTTPNLLTIDTPAQGTTRWFGPSTAQPGLTRGAGESANGTAYAQAPSDMLGNEVGFRVEHLGGPVTFRLSDYPSANLALGLLDSSGTPAGNIAFAANSFGGAAEILSFSNLAAGTYYVVVETVSGASPGSDFTVQYGVPPANDNCAQAEPVVVGGLYPFDSRLSSQEAPGTCSLSIDSPDIWYVFNPTQAGVATFSVCDADYEVDLSVHAGCGASASRCSSTGCPVSGASLDVCVTPGIPVYLRVAGVFDVTGTGTVSVAFDPSVEPPYSAPPGTAEAEACGVSDPDTVNGGCDQLTPTYGSIALGEVVTGTVAADTFGRDADWYVFTLANDATVTVTGQLQLNAAVSLFSDPLDCGAASEILSVSANAPCRPGFSLSQALTAGTYAVVVAADFNANDCSGGQNGYWLRLSTPVACVADVDDGSGSGTPDGGVGIEDLLYYLGIYDQGVAAADVDDGSSTGTPDGGVGIEDLLYFLQRYDLGC